METKKRIEFIDLAKGVCILLVIMMHTDVNVDFPGLRGMREMLPGKGHPARSISGGKENEAGRTQLRAGGFIRLHPLLLLSGALPVPGGPHQASAAEPACHTKIVRRN